MIEGITFFQSPAGTVQKGKFPMPITFDSKRYVGKWVKQGPSVESARQSTAIPSEKVVITGWEVWKDAKLKPCIRVVNSGAYVLMFRSRPLQEAVNKLYGNQSKRRMVAEATGKTVAGEAKTDSGMFTQDILDKITKTSEPPLEGEVKFNDLTTSSQSVDVVVEKPKSKSKSNNTI